MISFVLIQHSAGAWGRCWDAASASSPDLERVPTTDLPSRSGSGFMCAFGHRPWPCPPYKLPTAAFNSFSLNSGGWRWPQNQRERAPALHLASSSQLPSALTYRGLSLRFRSLRASKALLQPPPPQTLPTPRRPRTRSPNSATRAPPTATSSTIASSCPRIRDGLAGQLIWATRGGRQCISHQSRFPSWLHLPSPCIREPGAGSLRLCASDGSRLDKMHDEVLRSPAWLWTWYGTPLWICQAWEECRYRKRTTAVRWTQRASCRTASTQVMSAHG